MPCRYNQQLNSKPPSTLLAVLDSMQQATKTVDASGSIGAWIRLKIMRGATTVETTAAEENTGSNLLVYTASLQNGDQIIVEVADTLDFLTTDTDQVTIPTPGYSFVPIFGVTNYIQISFEAGPGLDAFAAPNSIGIDVIEFNFEFQDANGVTGSVNMSGPKSAFVSVDDSAPYIPTGTSGASTISTAFGSISVVAVFGGGYDLQLNKWAYASLLDQRGIYSEQDEAGLTCAIMVDGATYLQNEDGTPITYLQVQ